MPRPLRDTDPSKIHLVTTRTRLAEILLKPSRWLNRTVGGIVARYANRWDIKIYAITILGNHYHVVCQGPSGHLSRFAENINREIAKRINRRLNRRGSFWGRRYDSQVTIEETDGVRALLYTLTNPVKHGLVVHPRLWPGLTSYWQSVGSDNDTYAFFHHRAYNFAKRYAQRGATVDRKNFETQHELRIEVLPCFEHLSEQERVEKLNFLIEEHTNFLVEQRYAAGYGFLGREAILAQPEQGTFPRDSSNSRRPRCYTKNPIRNREFKKEEREKRHAYTKSSHRYRSGQYDTEFPIYCFRPPTHHVPPKPDVPG